MTRVPDIAAEADRLLSWSKQLLADALARRPTKTPSPVSVQRTSSNRKLAPQRQEVARNGRIRNVAIGPFVSSTYVSIAATCPSSCRWKNNGCYAQTGFTRFHMDKRSEASQQMAALEVTVAEAAAVDGLWPRGVPQDGARGGRDLRLHVAGDVSCERGARALAAAAERWNLRGGGSVWTYTHRWQAIPRRAWGTIRVFASVEDPAELWPALRRGYAPAFVVAEFPNGPRAFTFKGVRLVPCPAEAGVRTCAECRLCLDRDLASRNTGIAFAFHGGHRVDDGKKRLRVLQQDLSVT
jgi:hypothetical protein